MQRHQKLMSTHVVWVRKAERNIGAQTISEDENNRRPFSTEESDSYTEIRRTKDSGKGKAGNNPN